MAIKEITSLQHPITKLFVKLRTSRQFRYEKKQVIITGVKQVLEAKNLEVLLIKKGFHFSLEEKETYIVTDEILKKATGVETPEPVAAIVTMPEWSSLEGKNWIICLDRVSDPGNLGTLLRTALALGWEGAFLTEGCVDPFNDKAIAAAKGATFRLPMKRGTLKELMDFATDFTTWIADTEGTPLSKISVNKKTLLILGNEARGISEELRVHFSAISIPISEMESLNVAAAGAILMYNLKAAVL